MRQEMSYGWGDGYGRQAQRCLTWSLGWIRKMIFAAGRLREKDAIAIKIQDNESLYESFSCADV